MLVGLRVGETIPGVRKEIQALTLQPQMGGY